MSRLSPTHCEGDCYTHGAWTVKVGNQSDMDEVADECPLCRDDRIEMVIDAAQDDEVEYIDSRRLLGRC